VFCENIKVASSFVITGTEVTTQFQSFLCSDPDSLACERGTAIAKNLYTSQTQVLTTTNMFYAQQPYYILLVGRGYTLEDTSNPFAVTSQIGY